MLSIIRKNSDRLSNLINQFLDLHKLDQYTNPLKVKKIEVIGIISSLSENFRHYAGSKELNLRLICETKNYTGWFDEEKVSKILSNLLSNAIKFTPPGGDITILLAPGEDELKISVEDNGCGISEAELPHIFERFFRCATSSPGTGTGIGLSVVQKLVDLHHGQISVISKPGIGSVFSVVLPSSRNSYLPEEFDDDTQTLIPLAVEEKEIKSGKQQPIVLVIDDEPDMSQYIADSLSAGGFEVFVAYNALDGQKKALRYIPDLIIIDVMMPGMTGFELSKMLKADFRTSHIPLIILTAKSNEEDILKGYSTGAENYITKPFNMKQLLMKIENTIRFRGREEQKAVDLKEALKLNEREQEFMDRLIDTVKSNLSDPDYYIDDLCKEIGVSRMQLHRKLNALIGKTASELIREIKLNTAKEMLRSGNYNVNETAYLTGFKSSSHFSRLFKKMFGESPSEHGIRNQD